VTLDTWLANPSLQDEVFGAVGIVVTVEGVQDFASVAEALEGQLTATVHTTAPSDATVLKGLLPILERKAGRVLFNGFPTGVEVCDAMVHGGPYPATSDSRSASIGSMAIERFLRPVCYQDLPAWLEG